jgi:hypothetical protein
VFILPKPSELVQCSARLVRSTSNVEVKESNKFVIIMEEASKKTKADDDYTIGELVLIVSFNFVIYFCRFCFLFSIKGMIKFVITQVELSYY